jgi:hypothetical protein
VGQLFVRHSCALWTLWSLISNIPLPFCHRCVGSFQFQALWSLILPSFQLQSKMPVYVQVSSKSGTAFQIVYDSLLNLQCLLLALARGSTHCLLWDKQIQVLKDLLGHIAHVAGGSLSLTEPFLALKPAAFHVS